MNTYLWVFLGGGMGSIARYGVSRLVTSGFQHVNPYATLLSNILSTSILAGLMLLIADKTSVPHWVKLMTAVGFCGGFSTFSTFAFETFELLRTGQTIFAIANVFISITLGLLVLYTFYKLI